jgi:CRP-like cAMP-binding protein
VIDREKLLSAPIFEGVSVENLDLILELGREINYEAGTVILEQSSMSAGSDLFVVLQGMVKVELEAEKNQIQTTVNKRLAVLKGGDVFGEIGLVKGKARTARVSAYSDVTVLKIDRRKLYELFDQDPRLGYQVMHNLAAILSDRIVDLNFMWRDDI